MNCPDACSNHQPARIRELTLPARLAELLDPDVNRMKSPQSQIPVTTLFLLCCLTTGCGQSESSVNDDLKSGRHSSTVSSDTINDPEPSPQETSPDLFVDAANSTATANKVGTSTPANLSPPRHRLPDNRPDLNPQRQAAARIQRLQSDHLILLTDRATDSIEDLPALADELFEYLQHVCGPLSPAPDGAEFQVTGFLMVDENRFTSAGLIPPQVVGMRHGQQFGYSFWIRNQEDDYYLRHLLLHEFVHCYMTCETRQPDIPPAWFMEGAAEIFATHRRALSGTTFGVLPENHGGFEGWGRISEIGRRLSGAATDEVTAQTVPPLEAVLLPAVSLIRDDARYAYWWALCWMLSTHPEYSGDWAALCRCRGQARFSSTMARLLTRAGHRLRADWLLFAESVCVGFDPTRSYPVHRSISNAPDSEFKLSAGAGWQDSGHVLQQGMNCDIVCRGSCILATTTAPWVTEPQGITLEYSMGRPLGEVLAVIVDGETGWISRRVPLGRGRRFVVPHSGRLWLQINDSAAQRADNSGSFTVSVRTGG